MKLSPAPRPYFTLQWSRILKGSSCRLYSRGISVLGNGPFDDRVTLSKSSIGATYNLPCSLVSEHSSSFTLDCLDVSVAL